MKLKKLLSYIFANSVNFGLKLLSQHNRSLTTSMLLEKLDKTITLPGVFGKIRFEYNSLSNYMDSIHFRDRDPKLVEWIDSFDEEKVMYDIGANIGTYSVYAALSKKMKVLAFEPLAHNNIIINRNIQLNHVDDFVSAYCIALSNKNSVEKFHLPINYIKNYFNGFDLISNKQEGVNIYKHSGITFLLDDFVEKFSVPFPTYLKIDVDGAEDRIIDGARKTLSDKRLKSIYIEIDTVNKEFYSKVTKTIEDSGFKLVRKDDNPNSDHCYKRIN